MTIFAEALKQKQEARGESQMQFAEFLGLTQPTLSRIYRDRRSPGAKVLALVLIKYPDLAPFFVADYTKKNQEIPSRMDGS